MRRKVLVLLCILALGAGLGCASKKVEMSQEEATPPKVEEVTVEQETVVVETQPEMSARDLYEQRYNALPTSHTVKKGECLWFIAEYEQIYNDPFMWPLIYKANRGQINNPDLIYPGQVFEIPRYGFTLAELKDVRKSAGAPWKKLEPSADANLPADIRAELGYGF